MRYFLINDNKINISFDFDGVIHFNVCRGENDKGYRGLNNNEKTLKDANLHIIKLIVHEYERCNIHLVTARKKEELPYVISVLKNLNIYQFFSHIIATDHEHKCKFFKKYNIKRHYDDSEYVIDEALEKCSDMNLFQVFPKTGLLKKRDDNNFY